MRAYRILPGIVKAGWIRYRQRVLDVSDWTAYALPARAGRASAALVGNAGYLAGLTQGGEIDGHGFVLRLNNFRTHGYERQVGGRTDLFMTNFFKDIAYDRPELAGVETIIASVPNSFRKAPDRFLQHRHAEHIIDGMNRLGRREVLVPPDTAFANACAQCQAMPSTGYMALRFALDVLRPDRLFITGFSFFRGAEHYFPMPAAPRPRHDFERERILFSRELLPLVASGRVLLDEQLHADLVAAAQ
jgi:hypothetical protein